ncbi:MAG: competence/damage-inducible protein A [Verrucomicrobiia bacterium]
MSDVSMKLEIINTGSELLTGSVLNTHQQYLCKRLYELGFEVIRQISIPDTADEIKSAISDSLKRADVIITTGGLGPTSDDRTRDAVAELIGKKLIFDEQVAVNIRNYFRKRNRTEPKSAKVQAYIPEGAIVLQNQFGTAPGIVIEVDVNRGEPTQAAKSLLIMLPGPPRELYPMFDRQVIPLLKDRFKNLTFFCKILRTTGIPESILEETIKDAIKPFEEQGLIVGYCARVGEVDLRLEARGNNAGKIVTDAEAVARKLLGDFIYGEGDTTLESVIVEILKKKGRRVAVAESCTGGYVSHRITNVPGASDVFWGAVISYSNDAKMRILGVSESSLISYGAVSEQVAKEMAEGLRRLSKSDYAISLTGIAGPGGGSEQKPVGTVFIGLCCGNETVVKKYFNPYDRETFKRVASQQALEMLRRALIS